jgi:hypothetical protein
LQEKESVCVVVCDSEAMLPHQAISFGFGRKSKFGEWGKDPSGCLRVGVAASGGFDVGGWGDYANAVAGKVGAVLFAGCVAGVEGEGEDK